MRQLCPEHSGLQRVQPGIHTDILMSIFFILAMVGQSPYKFSRLIVIGKNRSPVTETAKHFRWEKRRASYISHSSGKDIMPRRHSAYRAKRLCIILYQNKIVTGGDISQRYHVTRLSEQMHRHNSLGSCRHHTVHALRINVESRLIDIGKHRHSAKQQNDLSDSCKRKRRHYHLIATLKSRRHKRQHESISSGTTRNRMFHAYKIRKFTFKPFNLITSYKRR
jgi:hypothetical protein